MLLASGLVAETRNAHLVLGTVTKHDANPLMVEDQPWEVRFDNLYGSVLYDDEREEYRCWYNPFVVDPGSTDVPRERRHKVEYQARELETGLCYATSKDGLTWTKPDLGLVEFKGSKSNNIIQRGLHGAGVFKDMREADARRRYKMVYGGRFVGTDWEPGVGVRFSEDGIHWSDPIECSEIEAEGDTHNNAMWVPELNNYVCITRLTSGIDWSKGQRTVGRIESSDFVNWSKAVEVLRGEMENQTYAMPVFRYGAIYLGLLMIIRQHDDRVQCELAWSPDTVRWERINPGTPLIPNGSTAGDYDWGCLYAAQAPVVLEDEIRIYYGGFNGTHGRWRDGSLCLATLRPDGWAGYEPVDSAHSGTVVTTPTEAGGELSLTADAAGGSVLVTVVNGDGSEVATSTPIEENVTNHPVTFAASDQLVQLSGRRVRLRFDLHNAKLYSFAFSV